VVELPPSGCPRVEVWLPNSASTMLRDVRVPEGATAHPAPADRPRWVHHGSSISHCGEAPSPTGTWPALIAARAGYSLTNLGLAASASSTTLAADRDHTGRCDQPNGHQHRQRRLDA
jgi:hypothetical protein